MTCAILLLCGLCGCAGSDRRPPKPQVLAVDQAPATTKRATSHTAALPSRTDQIRAAPAAFVLAVGEKTRTLAGYTCTMVREERRGLFGKVFGPERIACWFRQSPFSIRMKWLDPDVKYGESTYVADRTDAPVRFIPRHGLFGLPPGVTEVDVQTPVTWGEAKNPVTDFGFQRMMERTTASMARAGDTVTVSYLGIVSIPPLKRPVHHLRLEYPPTEWKTPFHDLYIDVESELPTGTVLSLPDGRLDAAYFYLDIDTAARPGDADFVLDAERDGKAAPTTKPTAPAASQPTALSCATVTARGPRTHGQQRAHRADF